jgi:hypothetical protein
LYTLLPFYLLAVILFWWLARVLQLESHAPEGAADAIASQLSCTLYYYVFSGATFTLRRKVYAIFLSHCHRSDRDHLCRPVSRKKEGGGPGAPSSGERAGAPILNGAERVIINPSWWCSLHANGGRVVNLMESLSPPMKGRKANARAVKTRRRADSATMS